MKRNDKCEAKRQAILEAAREEFVARGFVGARMDDIARKAGVAKGTLYLYFQDKAGLFTGLLEASLKPLHEHTSAILADESLTIREKMLQIYLPLLEGENRERLVETIRLTCAEGTRNPSLLDSYYRSLMAPIMNLHRENLSRAAVDSPGQPPHPALLKYPQLLSAPLFHGILWQSMLGPSVELDLKGLYFAYLDMILPGAEQEK